MARPSKTTDNVAVVEIGGSTRKAVIRWNPVTSIFVLLLSNHGRYNRNIAARSTVGDLLSAYNGKLLQN